MAYSDTRAPEGRRGTVQTWEGCVLTDMTSAEQQAFTDAITQDPRRLEVHIRQGGTVETYLHAWRTKRDQQAIERGETVDDETSRAILGAPLGPETRWGTPENTVRDYLTELLARLVVDGSINGKYGMVGDSDWEYDLFYPMYRLGLLPAWANGYGVGHRLDGTDHPEDRQRAYKMVQAACRALVAPVA